MGLADVRAGTQTYYDLLSTRPNISESHSEISTRVPFCIAKTGPALDTVTTSLRIVQPQSDVRLTACPPPLEMFIVASRSSHWQGLPYLSARTQTGVRLACHPGMFLQIVAPGMDTGPG